MRWFASLRQSSRSPLLQVIKTSVAAILAWISCAVLLGQSLPIFAAIAALLVVQPSVNQSLAKGIERSVGVVLGVVLAYAAGLIFGHASWIVLAIIVVSLLLAWVLRLSPGSANQIPISAMLVLALGAQTPGYALDRIIETVIGAVIGLLVNLALVPPVLTGPAHDAVVGLATSIAARLEDLAGVLRGSRDDPGLGGILIATRALRGQQQEASDAITRATESLTLNPRAGKRRARLEADRELHARLVILVTRVLGMSRALHDHYDPGLPGKPIARSIATELDRAAHDLLLLAKRTDGAEREAEPITAELPALTAPLIVAKPDPENWILLGSLLEDLRRVREVIVGEDE
jgi:uncharacterized membrane protein YccC